MEPRSAVGLLLLLSPMASSAAAPTEAPAGPSLLRSGPVARLHISAWKGNSLHLRTSCFLPIWSTYTPRPAPPLAPPPTWRQETFGWSFSGRRRDEAGTFLVSIWASFKLPLKLRMFRPPSRGGCAWGAHLLRKGEDVMVQREASRGRRTREDGWRET